MAVGAIFSLVGIGMQVYGQIAQANALKRQTALQEKQMNLEADRQRRDIIRNAIMARAIAQTNAANQGALFGSGLQGGYGQIAGRSGNQIVATNQNQEIGQGIFKAQRQYYNASIISSFGSGLSSLGNMFMQNAGTINRVSSVGYV
jgi:hypothetical protein